MGRTFKYQTLIREKHLDTFGHVNHAVYLELLEEARWEMMNEGGYDLKKVETTQIGPVILEVNIRYKHEMGPRIPIVIETQWLEYNRRVARLHQRIVSPDGKTEYAEAKLVAGLMDLQKRKLIRPTDSWLQTIGILESNPPVMHQ